MAKYDEALRMICETLKTAEDLRDAADATSGLLDDPEFLAACKPKKNPLLEKIVAKAVAEVLHAPEPPAMPVRMFLYSRANFYHGGGFALGSFFQVAYFQREQIGMVIVMLDMTNIQCIRIRAVVRPEDSGPSTN
jgi:acetyl esterase/lipase